MMRTNYKIEIMDILILPVALSCLHIIIKLGNRLLTKAKIQKK